MSLGPKYKDYKWLHTGPDDDDDDGEKDNIQKCFSLFTSERKYMQQNDYFY